MKNFCALALTLFAASLCADNANTESPEYARASLFGENNKKVESDTDNVPCEKTQYNRGSLFGENDKKVNVDKATSDKPHYTRASLFGEQESKPHKKRHIPRRPSSDVYLASPPTIYDFEFTSLILQPTGSSLHYAAEADPLPVPTPKWKIHDIDTDYHYGFDLGFSANFCRTNTNLTLDWEHFNSRDSATTALSTSNRIGPFFETGPDATPYTKARGKVKFNFNQVNLDYGIFIHLGSRLRTNLFTGLGFAQIKQNTSTQFSDPTGTIKRTINNPSQFIGAGPRFGLNFSYKIVKGFKFEGGFAADFFMGNLKNHTSYESTTPELAGLGITAPNKQKVQTSKRSQVVPGLEGNLSLAYTLYRNHYFFKLALGYETQIYLNAIQSADIGSEVNTPPVTPDTVGVYARTFQRTLSNFALSGPFVNATFGF